MRFCRSQFLLPEENIDFFEYPILFYHIRENFQTKTAGKQKSIPCEQQAASSGKPAHSSLCCLFPEKLSAPVLFPEKRGISPFFPVFSCPFPTGSTFLSCFPPMKLHFSRFQKCTLNRNSPFFPFRFPLHSPGKAHCPPGEDIPGQPFLRFSFFFSSFCPYPE